MLRYALAVTPLLTFSTAAFAQDSAPPAFNSGDTAWMLVSALLVLMMTLPGLALFYGGLVKKDNVLATLMQSLAVCAVVSVIWPVLGYSLAFTEGNGLVGGLDKAMLAGVTPQSASGTIPESVFIVFQMTFAIITAALLVGAVVLNSPPFSSLPRFGCWRFMPRFAIGCGAWAAFWAALV
jgi:ammonium transporter, Amt family